MAFDAPADEIYGSIRTQLELASTPIGGHDLIIAAQAAALDLIRDRTRHVDAMLLDVTLPGVPSRQVFEEAARHRPNLVSILTSAYSLETVAASFAGVTLRNFIRKPFRTADLVNLLNDRLSARSAAAKAG